MNTISKIINTAQLLQSGRGLLVLKPLSQDWIEQGLTSHQTHYSEPLIRLHLSENCHHKLFQTWCMYFNYMELQ